MNIEHCRGTFTITPDKSDCFLCALAILCGHRGFSRQEPPHILPVEVERVELETVRSHVRRACISALPTDHERVGRFLCCGHILTDRVQRFGCRMDSRNSWNVFVDRAEAVLLILTDIEEHVLFVYVVFLIVASRVGTHWPAHCCPRCDATASFHHPTCKTRPTAPGRGPMCFQTAAVVAESSRGQSVENLRLGRDGYGSSLRAARARVHHGAAALWAWTIPVVTGSSSCSCTPRHGEPRRSPFRIFDPELCLHGVLLGIWCPSV